MYGIALHTQTFFCDNLLRLLRKNGSALNDLSIKELSTIKEYYFCNIFSFIINYLVSPGR